MYAGLPGEFEELTGHINDGTKSIHTATVGDMIGVVERAYCATIRHRIETTILHPFGMTLGDFTNYGLGRFGDAYFRELAEEIRKVETGTELLLAGYGADGWPHVFRTDRKGNAELLDAYKFGAIGTGWMAATGLLLSRSDYRRTSVDKFAYRLCEAKFAAEGADGVGKETFIRVLYHDGVSVGSLMCSEKVRAAWEATRSPEIPTEVQEELYLTLQTNPDTRSRTGRRS